MVTSACGKTLENSRQLGMLRANHTPMTRRRTESETASCNLRFTPSSSTRRSHNLAECQLLTSLQFQNGFNPVIGHDNHGATNTARELWNHTFVHSLQALLLQNLLRAIER